MFDMNKVTGLPILGDVYKEYVHSELNLQSLLPGSPAFRKMMHILLDRYTELVHSKRDKRVAIKIWKNVTLSTYLRELRVDPFTEHPDSLSTVNKFCKRYPFACVELLGF